MTDLDRFHLDPEAEERFASEHPEQHMRRREFLTKTAMLAGAAGLASALPASSLISRAASVQGKAPLPSPSNLPIDTFVVLMQENRSFDHYFGWMSDKADAQNQFSYPDETGAMHPTHSLAPDFQGCAFNDPDHSWDGGRRQLNGGRMDGFRLPPNDDFSIGYYERKDLGFSPALADAYTLYDRYFCSLLAETWPNRLYQHSATSGGNKANAGPQDAAAAYLNGGLYRWETIWDLAIAQGISVGYYSSDLPFIGVFGRRYVTITKPVAQFYADAAAGNLPQIAFVDPPFLDGGGGHGLSADEHPHGDIRLGQAFISSIARAFVSSPQYRRGALFVNYDEWGGFFEHVVPPVVPDDLESEGYGQTGFRIPGFAVSPYTRGGRVSHMNVTHESILKLLSYRFGLGYLNKRHRYASNIGRSFDWQNPDFDPPDLPIVAPPPTFPCEVENQMESDELNIGSPEILDYLEAMGYTIYDPTPSEIFNSSDSATRRLTQQLQATGAL